jgi:hypothetical protein
MVDILNLRTAPDGSSSPALHDEQQDQEQEQEQVTTSPPPTSLKESIIQGLKGTAVQVPGDTAEDRKWQYTKTIPTSEQPACRKASHVAFH